jgi:hypothetical protein
LQSAPANLVLISLSLFMTLFVMAPTFDRAWQNGLKPMMDNKISQEDALAAVIEPFREFMLSQVREKDIGAGDRHPVDGDRRAARAIDGGSPLAANSLTGLVKVNINDTGQTATATTVGSLAANLPSTETAVAAADLPSANSASSTYTEALGAPIR